MTGKSKRYITPAGPGRGSAAQYRIVVGAMSDAVLTIDDQWNIVFANHAVEGIFGRGGELVGQAFAALIPERVRHAHMDVLRAQLRLTTATKPDPLRVEFPGLHRSGSEVYIEVTFGASHEGGRTYYTAVIRDITARKRSERRMALQFAVTQVLAASDTVEEAIPRLLQALCEPSGSDFAELWLAGNERRTLRSSGTWVASRRENRRLHEATLPEVSPRAGVVGRVWTGGHSAWTADMAEAGLLRSATATRLGLAAAIVIPVRQQQTAVGLIACYTRDARPPEPDLFKTLDNLGTQVGDFIARAHADEIVRVSEQRLRLLIRNAYSGILLLDRTGQLTFVSESVTRVLGYEPDELLGRRGEDLVHADDQRAWHEFFAMCLSRPRESIRIEYRCRHKDGTWRYIEGVGVNRLDDPAVGGIVDNFRDVTERKHGELALRQSEQRFSLAARGANDGLWDWDLATGTIYFSQRWRSMLGYDDTAMGNTPEAWYALVHPDDVAELQAQVDAHISGASSHFQSEHRIRHRDGEYRWVLCRGLAVRDSDGAAYRMAGSQSDITSRKASESLLLHEAMHDALTGLPNRAYFRDLVGEAIRHMDRDSGYRFAVLFLDLDRFKVINDSLGHHVGDELLMAIARRIEGCVRPGDTVARLGGDEFTILLDSAVDTTEAATVAERIQASLAVEFAVREHEAFVSASVGIVMGTPEYVGADDLLRDADLAMYRAKAAGKARHEVFDAGMRDQMVRVLRLETELRRAIERGSFVLHYQPIVSLSSGSIKGFEALVRWQHAERGLILPSEFIPIAEETGLIVPLGEWVLAEVCRQVQAWSQAGQLAPGVAVSVNLSGRQFHQPDLVQRVATTLQSAHVDPSRITFEITESVVMGDAEAAVDLLRSLHEMKLRLYIDDFGTGYSSLGYLRRFPVDTLKIDRSFVNAINGGGNDRALVNAIVVLAHSLGLDVIAEGVETGPQLDVLRHVNCSLAQGFMLSEPVEGPKAIDMIARTLC